MSLLELFYAFIKIGASGFGGPLALVAQMETEFCHRKNWIKPADFQKGFLYCKLLPGPLAYQMAVWIGFKLHRVWGGVIAGIAFLLPGISLLLVLTVFSENAWIASGLEKVFPAIRCACVMILGFSVYRLFQGVTWKLGEWLWVLLGIAGVFINPGLEPLWILGGGAIGLWASQRRRPLTAFALEGALLWQLFWLHFQSALCVFGTGIAVLPVLQGAVVEKYRWMSQADFLNGVAFSQMTPGPITITSTYIGYHLQGFVGAFIATLGMYLPGMILVMAIMPKLIAYFERKKEMLIFQETAYRVVLGCLAMSTFSLGYSTFSRPLDILFYGLSLGFILLKLQPAVNIILVGACGYLVSVYAA